MGVRHEHALGGAGRAGRVHEAGRRRRRREGSAPLGVIPPTGDVDGPHRRVVAQRCPHRHLQGGVGDDEPCPAVAQLVGEEVALEGGVEGHDDRAEPTEGQPQPDEVEATRHEHGNGVTRPDSEGGEPRRHLSRLGGGGGIRQRTLADDVHELLVAQRRCALLEGERQHPPGHVVIDHAGQTTTTARPAPCVATPSAQPRCGPSTHPCRNDARCLRRRRACRGRASRPPAARSSWASPLQPNFADSPDAQAFPAAPT